MHIWLHTAPPTYLIVDRPLVQHSVQSAMALDNIIVSEAFEWLFVLDLNDSIIMSRSKDIA